MRRRRLLARGQGILAAVSGGVDSMVLLDLLPALADAVGGKIQVAHFNHQLRGRASDADERLARRTAERLGLPFHAGRAKVKVFATQSGISLEMAARKLRHEFLARTAHRLGLGVVALAHHADDQVELFFLRWLRGAGGEGLAGMKWISPSPANPKIRLIRPLLGISKAELLAFARENRIHFREDATNAGTDFLRNRIRNELLPWLRKNYQPALDRNVLRLMEIVGAEAEYAGEAARSFQKGGRQRSGPFDRLPRAVQRRVLQQQLAALGVASDFELVEQLRAAAGRYVSIGSRLAVARTAAGKVSLREQGRMEFKTDELDLRLSGRAGRANFGGREFAWMLKKFDGLPPRQAGGESFDAGRIGRRVILRHWRAGDRFQPIGMAAAVKLQDLFVNAKIPATRRRHLVLATTGAGEIFWVDGLRIGERFKLTAETRKVLAWKYS